MDLGRMKKIIEIVGRYWDLERADTCAEHDEFFFSGPEPDVVSKEDLAALDELGADWDQGLRSWKVFT